MQVDLEELKRLEAAATPGPWRGDREDGSVKYYILGKDHDDWPDPDGVDFVMKSDNHNYGFCDNADERLVLAMRNALPALIAEVEQLRAANGELKRQYRIACDVNERKNRELDALHFVWCDGGCEGGVHRYSGVPVTRELVDEASRHLQRLLTWKENADYRAQRQAAIDAARFAETPERATTVDKQGEEQTA